MIEKNPWEGLPDAPAGGAPVVVPKSSDPWAGLGEGHVAKDPMIPVVPGPQNPKYLNEAIAQRERDIKGGIHPDESYGRMLKQGATAGWADEFAAAGNAPIQAWKRGVGLEEGYDYAKAFENLQTEMARRNTGMGGSLLELGGGLATAGPAIAAGPRAATKMVPYINREIPAGVVNYGANLLKGGGAGAVAGAGVAPTIEDVPKDMALGTAFGIGAAGVAAPVAGFVGRSIAAAARPVTGRMRGAEDVATEQLADVVRSSRRKMPDVIQELADARASGQPFTLADALGVEGQRKLAAMAKTPGEQRDVITDALIKSPRNLDMPIRTGSEVGRALGAPGTGLAAETALIDQARTQAGPIYRAAERIPTWNEALVPFLNSAEGRAGIARGHQIQQTRSIGNPAEPYHPRDAMITGVDPQTGLPMVEGVPNMKTLHTLKVGLDRLVEENINPATGRPNAYGAAVAGLRDRMLTQIDQLNPTYALARQMYGGPMRAAEAIDVGRDMSRRGLAADTVPAFRALSPTDQQAVRIGYADAIREPLERTGNLPTILRAKSAKGAQEIPELSLYQGPQQPGRPDQLRRFLNREETMQETKTAAKGGAATAENIADMAAGPGGLPEILGVGAQLAHGNVLGAGKTAAAAAARVLRGETEAQRLAITNALLTQDPTMAQALADRIAAHEARRRGVNPLADRPPRYAP